MTGSRFFMALLFFALNGIVWAQPGANALKHKTPWDSPFAYGSNMGYYHPWQDHELADIAMGNPDLGFDGVGVTSLRPAIFAHFLEQYGNGIRVDAFIHYKNLGGRDMVAFVGYPSEAQRETKRHCPDHPSEMFKGMYEPIWDKGENGTPVNDNNTYALFLYNAVKTYGDYVRVWEIWNEPDFDYAGKAWKTPDMEDSWWHHDPDPCEYALRAPVQYYIRLLRISYEVIKSLQPNDLIATGGLGFPSFMDAILRNTDNPVDGSVTPEFPYNAGAYFDVLSYHVYPHIDGSMRAWVNRINDFMYERNSDAGVQGVLARKREFENVLTSYGFDGKKYPEKDFIITEVNIPRKQFQDFIGSEEAQRNFLMKTLIAAQSEGIRQVHVYQLGEIAAYNEAKSEFHLMGLYEKLENVSRFKIRKTSSGIAYKTISDLLYGWEYDEKASKSLNAGQGIQAYAFYNTEKPSDRRYVLWATTTKDQSEAAEAYFTFPKEMKVKGMRVMDWEYSKTGKSREMKEDEIGLSGAPLVVELIR